MNINSVIIFGGGPSISEGLKLNIIEKIKNQCTLVCNLAYKTFRGTALCFVDAINNAKCFYSTEYGMIKHCPIAFGCNRNVDIKQSLENVIWLNHSDTYLGYNNFKKGVYSAVLTGYMAISTAIWLLEGCGEIFLCGFDWTRRSEEEKQKGFKQNPHAENIPINKRTKTHFYLDLHRGLGFTQYYEETNPNETFAPFLQEKNIKIYNVSPNSNIECFEKINYQTFFSKLKTTEFKQYQLQNYIRWKWEND